MIINIDFFYVYELKTLLIIKLKWNEINIKLGDSRNTFLSCDIMYRIVNLSKKNYDVVRIEGQFACFN